MTDDSRHGLAPSLHLPPTTAALSGGPPAEHAEGRERGRRRVMAHGDFRLILLAMIGEAPRHGYELIQAIAEAFHGHYTPSPGSIYPLLAQLQQSGHTYADTTRRGRKQYQITAQGMALLEQQRDAVAAAFERLRHNARHAMKRALPEEIRKAMHALKHALLMQGNDWSAEDIGRSSAAIRQAALLIAGHSRHA